MARRAKEEITLHDGVELSVNEFQAVRSDMTFFVNAGGIAYLTVSGTRRMALVPVEIGEAYGHAKRDVKLTAYEAAEAFVRGVIAPAQIVEAWAAADVAGISPDRFLELVLNAVEEEQADQRLTTERLENLLDVDPAASPATAEQETSADA
jgi:hypothetical protein